MLQHGVTPWSGGPVSVVVDGDTILAAETKKPGVYRAVVVVPDGDWKYRVIDPFGAEHGFPPVKANAADAAEPAAATTTDGSSPWTALAVAAAGFALLAAFGVLAVRRSLTPPVRSGPA